eukprot:1117158-Rhodomonas_salina.1
MSPSRPSSPSLLALFPLLRLSPCSSTDAYSALQGAGSGWLVASGMPCKSTRNARDPSPPTATAELPRAPRGLGQALPGYVLETRSEGSVDACGLSAARACAKRTCAAQAVCSGAQESGGDSQNRRALVLHPEIQCKKPRFQYNLYQEC